MVLATQVNIHLVCVNFQRTVIWSMNFLTHENFDFYIFFPGDWIGAENLLKNI
jgi:hypothetical protein